jgi:GGDEF domain-containing protein
MRDDPGARPPDERLARAAQAAQELSGALWEALRDELRAPGAERVAALAQRLSDVVATVALLADERPRHEAADASPGPAVAVGPAPARGESNAPPAPEEPEPPVAAGFPPGLTVEERGEGASPIEPAEPAAARIEIHDTRSEDEWTTHPQAWIGSIGRRLERYAQDGRLFAVLLIELLDVERLAQAEPSHELARLLAQVERALGDQLRDGDTLTREARGRWWLVSAGADAIGARVLAERLARAVPLAASHRGIGLEVAIGIALCPEDGREAAALAAQADVGLYAARAAGRSVAPVEPPAA